jgi:D-serine deaminase-like pyridoxal phosphate-dependent protein
VPWASAARILAARFDSGKRQIHASGGDNVASMTLPQPMAPLLPSDLDTPALVIDLDIVERNARRMAQALAHAGVALRPHVKTHKSVALARLQIEHGAAGITVGTLGEAEVMADGGITDIFLAYPVWAAAAKAHRLRALAERSGLTFAVGFDSVAGAHQLASAMAGSPARLRVVLEIDSQYGRTGVPADRAGEVAAAAQQAGLEVIGAFTHGGHSYYGPDAVEPAATDEVEALAAAARSLQSAGIDAAILSAGSSPTALAAARPPVTEMRAGTYLIGDRLQVAIGASPADGVAIAVAATVVSDSYPGQVVIDAGAKSLTKDVPAFLSGFGTIPAYPDGVIERVSDYHGQVRFPDGAARPHVGEVVAVVPNHACPVIDLYDSFVATRSGAVVGSWRVDARGRSG